MLLTSRSLLPLFLVILQVFAPLLHAHAGQQNSHFGLHVPGLESYDSTAAGVFADQIKLSVSNSGDGIVAIDQGIRENRTQTAEDVHNDCYLPFVNFIFRTAAECIVIKDFSHPPLLPSRFRSLPLSPRAPPVI